jgi:cell division protein FtsI/penicillin-binding protein 2
LFDVLYNLGTAKEVYRVEGINICGKTGTAETQQELVAK